MLAADSVIAVGHSFILAVHDLGGCVLNVWKCSSLFL